MASTDRRGVDPNSGDTNTYPRKEDPQLTGSVMQFDLGGEIRELQREDTWTRTGQNAKTLEEYCDHLDQARLPVVRGLALTRDDLARRAVIMALMCQGQVLFESIELAWLLDFRDYFAPELEQLREYEEIGLLLLDEAGIQVTAKGWYFVRAIAMVFDRYLQADRNRARFSRII